MLGIVASPSLARGDPFIEGLGTLSGKSESRAYGATADGCIVVGSSGNSEGGSSREAFIYEKNFMRRVRDSGAAIESAVGVSEYGVATIGNNGSGVWGVDPTQAWHSVRHESSATEVEAIPRSFRDATVANSLSANGQTMVGSASGAEGHDYYPWEAYRWNRSTGFSYLDPHSAPIEPAAPASSAEALSSDGSIAVGWARYAPPVWNGSGYDDFREAVRWDGSALTQLGFATGATHSEATGISADGSVIVGISDGVGFRYLDGAMEEIGSILPSDVSGDGAVIVGQLAGGTAGIWDSTSGQHDLGAWLSSEHGVDLTGWTLDRVEVVSEDGRTFVGTGTNPEGGFEAWRVALDGCVSEILPLGSPGTGATLSIAVQPDDSSFAVSFNWPSQRVVIISRLPVAPIEIDDPALDAPRLLPGPGGSFYGLNRDRNTLVRIDADGNVSTLFDVTEFVPPFDPTLFASPQELEQYTPNDSIRDFAVAADGAIVLTTLQSVIRIETAGTATVMLDPTAASELLDAGQYLYFGFWRVLLAPGGTVFVHVFSNTGYPFENAVLEIPLSGQPTVHRSPGPISHVALSPGGEVWVLSEGGAYRLDGRPIVWPRSDTDPAVITHPLTLNEYFMFDTLGGLAKFTPAGDLLVRLNSFMWPGNELLSLNPLEYDFDFPPSVPAGFVAGPLLQPISVPSIFEFATSDRAIYITTLGDTVVRIPQKFGPVHCSDGTDNDGDGQVDWPEDPGCTSAADEAEHQSTFACDDGIDNDSDGFTDYSGGDAGCAVPRYHNESPQCNDGINNDPAQDRLIDMDDARCKSPADPSESCGLGFELALILPALMVIRQRRRRA